jgi:hypothetical protein
MGELSSERASVARQEIARDSAVGAQSLAIPEWNIIALGLAFLCGCMPPNTVRRPEFRRNFGEKNVEGNKRRGKALLVHTTNATRQKGAGGLHWYIQLAAHQIECGHTCYCRGAKEVFHSHHVKELVYNRMLPTFIIKISKACLIWVKISLPGSPGAGHHV